MIPSFQEVRSKDRAGADKQGWYYHISMSEEMKDKILSQNCTLFLLFRLISVSITGKRSITPAPVGLSHAKCWRDAQKAKKKESGQPTNTSGVSGGPELPPVPPKEKGGIVTETSNEDSGAAESAAKAVQSASLMEGTQPAPSEETPEEREEAHILTGEEYQQFVLLQKQEANRQKALGTSSGAERGVKRSPGRPKGSHSKCQGSQAGRGTTKDAGISKYLS